MVRMHALAAFEMLLLLLLFLDAVFLFLRLFSFLVVKALTGFHVFLAPNRLLSWVVVDIGSK